MHMPAFRQPNRIIDLLAYSSVIVNASRGYEDKPWLHYDRHFRTAAAAKHLQTWAEIDSSLWTLYFSNAKPKQVCRDCHSPDHTSCQPENNPRNPTSQVSPRFASRNTSSRYQPYPRRDREPPICKRWNYQGCIIPSCTYQHICLVCRSKDHRVQNCPAKANQGTYKQQPPAQPFLGERWNRQ